MRLCYSLVMFMALLMLVSGASLLSGCGKKGPLYHPPATETPADKAKAKAKADKTKPNPTP